MGAKGTRSGGHAVACVEERRCVGEWLVALGMAMTCILPTVTELECKPMLPRCPPPKPYLASYTVQTAAMEMVPG